MTILNRPRLQPGLLCTCLSLLPLAARCQTTPDVTVLPPVVISGSGHSQFLSDALPAVSVIERQDIENSGATQLTTLLQQLTGVQLSTNGGPGQPANMFVRGYSGPNLLVLLDGVPINAQDSTGIAYLHNLGTDQIERLEVIRGNVSALYGSGAIGGAVLITTRSGAQGDQAAVAFSIGSRDTTSSSLNTSATLGNTQLAAGLTRTTTQAWPSINPGQLPDYLPSTGADGSDGYRNTTQNASIVQQVASGQKLGLQLFSSDGSYSYANATAAGENQQTLFRLFSDNQISNDWSSKLSLARQTTENRDFSYGADTQTVVDQLLWHNEVRLGQGWTLTAGNDLQWQHLDANDGPGALTVIGRRADAVFAGVDGWIGDNQLQLNGRADSIEGIGLKNTGYLGYGRDLGSGFKAIASASTAFNAPPLGYLYTPIYGNPGLQPEQSHAFEGGLQWSQDAAVWRGTLFQTRTSNQWTYNPLTFVFTNLASTQTRGLELSARGGWQGWTYDANLTLQQPVDLTQAGDPTLQRQARSLANLGLNRELAGMLVGAAVHYTGPRWDNDDSGMPTTLGAYTTVDLSASGKLSPSWSWNARLENLFDKQYQTVWGYNRVPFGVFLGLTWHPIGS